MKNPSLPFKIAGLSILYATALAHLERKYPNIKPDYIWAEVAGGVAITLIPIALEARKQQPEPRWQDYEAAVFAGFIASGGPTILWQLIESHQRTQEILQAALIGAKNDTTTPLACGMRAAAPDHHHGHQPDDEPDPAGHQ